MAEVTDQAVRYIQCGVRDAAQGEAECHAWLWCMQAQRSLVQYFRVQLIFLVERTQGQACIAERAGDPDIVADLRGITAQCFTGRGFAEYGDADIQRPFGGISTYEFTAVCIGQFKQAM
ncbi:hypothetical protein D3C81_1430440 [compost metagenome]